MTILPELRDHPQYEVLRELGRGGMGVVYLAKNKIMDRQEVLKVVNKQLLGEAGAAERFLREIRSAAQLNHPNIVTAYSALQVGDLLLFSMEFIEGRDLAQVVKARGPLPATHAGSYVLQAARGLQHAFERGMVHRDVKPQNLILDGKTNIVKILDFGLAKATSRTTTGDAAAGLTGLNMMMGTPDYMAPEQARDAANVDIRADIYSLGCTLYCLLAGRAPFVGGSLATKIAAHQLSEPDPVESQRSDLPPGLTEIVRKMMAKDPEKRYQKPEEVAQALTICFKGKGKQPTAKAPPENVRAAKPPAAASKLSVKREEMSIFEKKTIAPMAAPRQTMRERPSPVARMKKEATALWRKKWLMGAGGAAAALLLTCLIGLWAAGVFKVKSANGDAPPEKSPPPNPRLLDAPAPTTPRSDYDMLAKGLWVAVLPSVEEFDRLRSEKAYWGAEPKFVGGVLQLTGGRLLFPPIQAKNAIVRAWVSRPGPKNTGHVALELRSATGESVGAWFNGGGFFGIGQTKNHSYKNLQTCQFSEQYDGFFEFAFAAAGDRLIAYADGRKILEARDEAPLDRPAAVGVSTIGYGLFRDVEVQILDKPPGKLDMEK